MAAHTATPETNFSQICRWYLDSTILPQFVIFFSRHDDYEFGFKIPPAWKVKKKQGNSWFQMLFLVNRMKSILLDWQSAGSSPSRHCTEAECAGLSRHCVQQNSLISSHPSFALVRVSRNDVKNCHFSLEMLPLFVVDHGHLAAYQTYHFLQTVY